VHQVGFLGDQHLVQRGVAGADAGPAAEGVQPVGVHVDRGHHVDPVALRA
jgi:hypothetical protein